VTVHRHLLHPLLALLGRAERDHVGVDWTGMNRVHPDFAAAEVDRCRLSQRTSRPPCHRTRRAGRNSRTRPRSIGATVPALARREREASQNAGAPAQPGEKPQEVLRRELMALDCNGLRTAAQADVVNQAFIYRPMTVQDVARQLDPAYAVAGERAEQLRKQTAEVAKSIAHYEGVVRSNRAAGDRRWQEMGFLRQVAHKTGAAGSLAQLERGPRAMGAGGTGQAGSASRRAGAAIAGREEDRGHGLRAH
jgi:hypothetical protein